MIHRYPKERVMFHGTVYDFEDFDHNRSGLGTHFGTRQAAKDRAQKIWRWSAGDVKSVRKYLLFYHKPLRLPDVGDWNSITSVSNALKASIGADLDSFEEMRAKLDDLGYDAILYENRYEDPGKDSIVLWHSRQIMRLP